MTRSAVAHRSTFSNRAPSCFISLRRRVSSCHWRRDQACRVYDVLEYRLREAPFLAGDDYSIADIMCWVWAAPLALDLIGLNTETRPATQKWFEAILARPAVQYATSREDPATPARHLQSKAVLTPAQCPSTASAPQKYSLLNTICQRRYSHGLPPGLGVNAGPRHPAVDQ